MKSVASDKGIVEPPVIPDTYLIQFGRGDPSQDQQLFAAANLTAKITEVNLEKKLVRALPAETQVEEWIRQAKSLPKAISH